MKNSIVRKPLVTALLCLSCSIPIIASAAVKTTAERTVKVSAEDLNLVDEQGVAELYQRLKRASRSVCGSANVISAGSLKQRQLNQQCYQATLKNAVQDFGNAKLIQLQADSK